MRSAYTQKKSHLSAILFFLAAGVGLPLVFTLSTTHRFDSASAVLVIGIIIYATTHLAALIGAGVKRPIQGVFWLFVYIAMGVAPLAQLTTGLSQRLMDPGAVTTAYLITIVGLVSYDIGHLLAGRREDRREVAFQQRPARTELREARLRIVSLVALAVTAYNIASNGIAIYFSSRQETAAALDAAAGTDDGQAIRGILSAMGSVPQLVSLLCWIVLAASQRRKHGKSTFEAKLWIVVLGSLLLLTNNIFSASRFWVLTIAVSVFFVIPWVRASLYRSALIGGAIAAIAVFPLSDMFRLSADYREQYGFQNQGMIQNLAIKDYDQMVMTANGVWYTEQVGFHLGQQMLGNVLFWVPRSIWPDKPIDTGVEIGTAMQSVNVNLSSPLWIELYVDLAWPAVVIGFILVGFVSRLVDSYFAIANGSFTASALQVLVPLVAGYQFILLRGPLLQSMGRLAVMLVLLWFIFTKIRVPKLNRAQQRLAEVGSLR